MLLWAAWGSIAAAQGPVVTRLELSLPPKPAVGQELALAARLTDGNGAPVSGKEVVFSTTALFLNTEGEVELGRAITDERGIALFSFVPRTEGEVVITARFAGDRQHRRSVASATAVVAPGPSLYVQTAGVRVPGINVGWLVGLLAAVWGTYLTVMVLLVLVAREGRTAIPTRQN